MCGIKKLAKWSLRVFYDLSVNSVSLGGGEKLRQFRRGVMGSWPVTAGNSTLARMSELGLNGKPG